MRILIRKDEEGNVIVSDARDSNNYLFIHPDTGVNPNLGCGLHRITGLINKALNTGEVTLLKLEVDSENQLFVYADSERQDAMFHECIGTIDVDASRGAEVVASIIEEANAYLIQILADTEAEE